MQPFEYRSIRYWSKEINWTLLKQVVLPGD